MKLARRKLTLVRGRTLIVLLPLICIALFIALCFRLNVTQDDAYITFRYAENFASGHGLVWNIGERVEGYTNFLWLIILILGKSLRLDYLTTVKVLGPLLSVGSIVLTFAIFRRALAPKLSGKLVIGAAFASALALATNYSFVFWSVAGLETALFGFLTLLSFYAWSKRSWLLAPLLALAILTRPEGALLAGFFVLYGFLSYGFLSEGFLRDGFLNGGWRGKTWPRYELISLALAALTLAPYAVFKLAYFGDIFPNPFYAKTGWDSVQLYAGLDYLWNFLKIYGLAGVIFLLPAWRFRRLPEIVKAMFLFAALYTLYITLIGGDVLKMERFFFPILAPLYIAFVSSLLTLPKPQFITAGVMTTLLAVQFYLPLDYVEDTLSLELGLSIQMEDTITGLLQADTTDFNIAASTIGVCGYLLLGHQVYDMVGLTDSAIARHPQDPIEGLVTTWRERKYNAGYILSLEPDYIFFSTGVKPSSPGERALFLYPAFLNSYNSLNFYSQRMGRTNGVYKRFADSLGPIERTVDVRFVQNYNEALNSFSAGAYEQALLHLDSARQFSPTPTYSYLYYHAANCLAKLGRTDQALRAADASLAVDSNLYSSHSGLYLSLYPLPEFREKALMHRRHIIRLAPWELARLDREVGYVAPAIPPDSDTPLR